MPVEIVVAVPRWCPTEKALRRTRNRIRRIARGVHDALGLEPPFRRALVALAQEAYDAAGGFSGVLRTDPLEIDDDEADDVQERLEIEMMEREED